MIHGWPVQFVEASHDELWAEAIETAEIMEINGREVRVIDPEHLAAMWIQAGRRKDIRKIEMFDEAGKMDSSILKALLESNDLMDACPETRNTRPVSAMLNNTPVTTPIITT